MIYIYEVSGIDKLLASRYEKQFSSVQKAFDYVRNIYTKEPCSTISLQARLHNGIPKYNDGSYYVSKGGGVEEDGFDASTLAVYDFTGYVPLNLNERQMYKEKAEKAINKMNERLQKQNKYR